MISAVILTKNEERNIKSCIKSVKWCDEILVVDDYSEDQTVKITEFLGARVLRRRLNGDFASQRNFGLEKARGEWVMFLDADERLTNALALEVSDKIKNSNNSGFLIKRHDILWGKELKHGEVASVWLLRLAKKGMGRWRRRVHEVWDIKGEIGRLHSPLLHYPHQTLSKFLADIDFYSTLHAEQKLKDGENVTLFHIYFWQKFKFLNNWIIKLGFLDGTAGFVHAAMMSFHSFLAWSKLWLLQLKPDRQ